MYNILYKVLNEDIKNKENKNFIGVHIDNDKCFELLSKAFIKSRIYHREGCSFERLKFKMKDYNEKYIYISLEDLKNENPYCILTSNARMNAYNHYTCKKILQILKSYKIKSKNKLLINLN